MKKIRLVAAAALAAYGVFFAVVLYAMFQPPVAFGRFMKHAPAPLVWGALPAAHMWRFARAGALEAGDPAPDFTLPTRDGSSNVTLSSMRGVRPVVLIFGSYT